MSDLAASVKHLAFSVISVAVWLLLMAMPSRGQEPAVLGDDELYERASSASNKKDYVAAMVYIYAYIQKNPKSMRDSKYRFEVVKFYETVKAIAFPVAGERHTLSTTPPQLPPKPNAQPSQLGPPLVCRGGGNLHFNYTPYSNISDKAQIWITFERGTTGVGANKENIMILSPGQCTWLDRAVSHQEPNTLVLTESVFEGSNFGIQWQGGKVTGITSQLSYLNVLQNEHGFQTFRAYNDGKGNFVVTKIE